MSYLERPVMTIGRKVMEGPQEAAWGGVGVIALWVI